MTLGVRGLWWGAGSVCGSKTYFASPVERQPRDLLQPACRSCRPRVQRGAQASEVTGESVGSEVGTPLAVPAGMKPLTSSADRASPWRSVLTIARRGVPFVVIAALLVGGYVGYRHWRGGDAAVTYTTAAADRGDVVQAVTASGTLQPVVQSTVGSQVSGRVNEILVDFNDTVKQGDVLARIDRRIFEGQLAQAKARLASARAELERAQATAANARAVYDRTVGLLPSGAVAASEVDAAQAAKRTAEASIQTAKSSIVEAQAAVENAQTNLAYTVITAPISGVVVSRSVDVGQTVAASLQAPTLFVIAGDLAQMELHTSVAEADVGQVKEGMKVELAFDAFPERTFEGTVKQVRNQATTVSNVVTYDAVVAVANEDGVLRPGMTATATFVVAEARDVLVVQQKALRYRPANVKAPEMMATRRGAGGAGERRGERPAVDEKAPSQPQTQSSSPSTSTSTSTGKRERGARGAGVWVLRDGKPVRVRVEPGLSDGTMIEIKGGELQEGDLVITADSSTKGAPGGGGPGATGGRRGNRGGPPRLF